MKKRVEFLRRFKASYAVYNFFQYKKLKHNLPLYKKYGLKKWYFSLVSSKDFENLPQQANVKLFENPAYWQANTAFQLLGGADKQSMLDYAETGFVQLKNFLSEETVDRVNAEIDQMLQSGKAGFRYRNKIMFAIHQSTFIKSIGEGEKFLSLLSLLLGGKAHLFQSINFLQGSQQATHSVPST